MENFSDVTAAPAASSTSGSSTGGSRRSSSSTSGSRHSSSSISDHWDEVELDMYTPPSAQLATHSDDESMTSEDREMARLVDETYARMHSSPARRPPSPAPAPASHANSSCSRSHGPSRMHSSPSPSAGARRPLAPSAPASQSNSSCSRRHGSPISQSSRMHTSPSPSAASKRPPARAPASPSRLHSSPSPSAGARRSPAPPAPASHSASSGSRRHGSPISEPSDRAKRIRSSPAGSFSNSARPDSRRSASPAPSGSDSSEATWPFDVTPFVQPFLARPSGFDLALPFEISPSVRPFQVVQPRPIAQGNEFNNLVGPFPVCRNAHPPQPSLANGMYVSPTSWPPARRRACLNCPIHCPGPRSPRSSPRTILPWPYPNSVFYPYR
ncbi:hypothetical protein GOP47_0003366 [Adiantum capillus-veneris]|uniref:Uncharacterized protein n=1 Tax=Adiantum capillus-veneris TaxID=13818 RepID=A0A9D4VCB4_ADICA|nr:hypothetical protein GOP47_0003366 [Adiantum capillus-veneris]